MPGILPALATHYLAYFYNSPMRKVLLLFYHEETKFERVYAISQGHVAVSGEA